MNSSKRIETVLLSGEGMTEVVPSGQPVPFIVTD